MRGRYLFIIAVIAVIVGLAQLGSSNHTAANLASKITADDTASTDSTTDEQALAAFVKRHMGTSQTVVLSTSYNRAVQAAQAAASPATNGSVYAAAQAACASHADSLVQARCVQAYLSAHSTSGANPQPVATPNKSDYTKVFTAPAWTADGAGIAFLVALTATVGGGYLVTQRRV